MWPLHHSATSWACSHCVTQPPCLTQLFRGHVTICIAQSLRGHVTICMADTATSTWPLASHSHLVTMCPLELNRHFVTIQPLAPCNRATPMVPLLAQHSHLVSMQPQSAWIRQTPRGFVATPCRHSLQPAATSCVMVHSLQPRFSATAESS